MEVIVSLRARFAATLTIALAAVSATIPSSAFATGLGHEYLTGAAGTDFRDRAWRHLRLV